jgi:uncharacterized protein YihD (DUF1040 family)
MKIKAFTALCVYPADQIEDVSDSVAVVTLRLADGAKRTIHVPVATEDYESREAFVTAVSKRAGDLWDTAQTLDPGEGP